MMRTPKPFNAPSPSSHSMSWPAAGGVMALMVCLVIFAMPAFPFYS
jgi:hypothetical protein